MAIEWPEVELLAGCVLFIMHQRKQEIDFALIISGSAVTEQSKQRRVESPYLLVVRKQGFKWAQKLELSDGVSLFPITVDWPKMALLAILFPGLPASVWRMSQYRK